MNQRRRDIEGIIDRNVVEWIVAEKRLGFGLRFDRAARFRARGRVVLSREVDREEGVALVEVAERLGIGPRCRAESLVGSPVFGCSLVRGVHPASRSGVRRRGRRRLGRAVVVLAVRRRPDEVTERALGLEEVAPRLRERAAAAVADELLEVERGRGVRADAPGERREERVALDLARHRLEVHLRRGLERRERGAAEEDAG
mmetsp:Transcript_4438/g.18020  ORF Transcript_4438/g.18020 Transcript_4438/m.18020 type:complete len:201 (-) Transcript_4438:1627-2229(-)